MPIYEYACNQCEHAFETLVRASSVPSCPRCHSTALTKQLSVFATAGGAQEPTPLARVMAGGPCGTCGHPDGPGACTVH